MGSCPNVKHGGGDSIELAARVSAVTKVRDEMKSSAGRRVPIFVKLGDVGDAEATVKLLAKHGVDGIVTVNTQRSMEQSAAVVAAVRKQGLQDRFIVVHGGGLSCAKDVQRSRSGGADLRQWYTGMVNALAEGHSPKELYPTITAGAGS